MRSLFQTIAHPLLPPSFFFGIISYPLLTACDKVLSLINSNYLLSLFPRTLFLRRHSSLLTYLTLSSRFTIYSSVAKNLSPILAHSV